MSRHKLNELMSSYKSSYTLPKHPKFCPDCGHKVKVFHMNILNQDQNAIILCSNPIRNSCVWPLDTGRKDILGKSDVSTLQKIQHERMKIASSTGETFETSFDSTINDDISPTKLVLTGRKSADQAHHEKLRTHKFSHVLTSAPNLGMIISTYTTQMKQLIV